MKFVPTIDDLRSLLTTTDDSVLVGSYYDTSGQISSKNGGGIFLYDANDTGSPDNGGTIIVSTVGPTPRRRWKRQIEGSLTPAMFGAKGNGEDDDADRWGKIIAYAVSMLQGGQSNVVIDGQGLEYGLEDQLMQNSGIGLVICNAKFIALSSTKWSSDGTVGYLSAQIPDLIRTNNVLSNRNLIDTNYWNRPNMMAVRDIGIDGVVDSATRLTASGSGATIIQALTAASALRVQTAFVKRISGSGTIEMTMDGTNWTKLENPSPVAANYTQYRIEQTVVNPQIGFRIAMSGDVIAVDFVQNEVADGIPVASPPLETTASAVTRIVPSTYMLRINSGAQSTIIQNVQFDCKNLCGGVFFSAFSTQIEYCRFDNVAGIGIRQEAGGARVSFNLITQSQLPNKRGGIGIYSAQADGKFFGNIARFLAWPFYFGKSEVVNSNEWATTGVWVGNHAYNGDDSNPDSGIMYFGTGSHSNIFVDGYLDNGGIHIRNRDQSFWNNRVTWINTNAKALFTFWTTVPNTDLDKWNFGGLEYSDSSLTAAGSTVWAFRITGSGTWDGINSVQIAALDGGARFDSQRQEFVSNDDNLPKFFGKGVKPFMALYGKATTIPPEIGVSANALYFRTGGIASRFELAEDGTGKWLKGGADIQYKINKLTQATAKDHLEGQREVDDTAFAQTDYDNRGINAYVEDGSTIAATASLRAYRDGEDNSAMFRMTLSMGGNMANAFKFSQNGMGYSTGMSGAVTQVTSKSTAVLLDKPAGAITLHAASLAAGTIVSFVLNNSTIAATDVLILNHISGGTPGAYSLNARAASGSATINVRNNTAAALGEAIVIRFVVIKA